MKEDDDGCDNATPVTRPSFPTRLDETKDCQKAEDNKVKVVVKRIRSVHEPLRF
jgi:hypothetical protein